MACLRCGTACVSEASSDWWMVCYTPYSLSKDTQTPAGERRTDSEHIRAAQLRQK